MKVYGKLDTAIQATVGEPFVVQLEALPGAGYLWDARVEGGALHLVKVERGVPSGIGGAAVDQLTFMPVALGEALIIAEHRRPWEPAAIERVVLHVSIEAAR